MSKILFISTNGGYGGSEVLWLKVMEQLDQQGIAVAAWIKAWKKKPLLLENLQKAGTSVYENEMIYPGKMKKVVSLLSGKRPVYQTNPIDQVIEQESPDFAVFSIGDHADYEFTEVCESLLAKNIPYIILVQLATELRGFVDEFALRLQKSYLGAKYVYFLSDQNKKVVENHIGNFLANSRIFHSPFNISYLSEGALRYISNEDVYTIGMVTNFDTFHKGHDLIIEALSKRFWEDKNLIINLYGGGHHQLLIERLIKMYGVGSKIVLKGYEPDPRKIWEINQACLFVSRMEGQSLAMLDAISLGRMVIATDVGDAVNLVEDNETGFIIPFPKTEAVQQTLERAWEKRGDWLTMGEKGQRKLRANISTDPVVTFTNEVLGLL